MSEAPSDTSDEQRFDEMLIHLTPRGATVPYSVCTDPEGNIWVAAKGGLFKFHGERRTTLWERKNPFPKKMAAFSQVVCHNNTIVYTCGEDKEKTTEMRFFSLDGTITHEQFFEGLIYSLDISEEGEIYISKQPTGMESVIQKTSFDAPLGWDDVIISTDDIFQSICVLDEQTLVASMAFRPLNPFSKQRLVLITIDEEGQGKITKSFSTGGKKDGEVFFPRKIVRHGDGILLMDKSGRFLQFSREGEYQKKLAEIDAYLANSFCVKDGAALMGLSGIVREPSGSTICDDWLELINLDGDSWKKQRIAKRVAEARKKMEEVKIEDSQEVPKVDSQEAAEAVQA